MKVKDFLLNECENLDSVLQQTLRYEYGLDGSQEFYVECAARLAHIKDELADIQDDNSDGLSGLSYRLNELSHLISRIERSSLGQYSWPFVEEFKEITRSVCTEARRLKPSYPPKVHVLSEGGLDAYLIWTEQNRSISERRILTIVFPRTLKHFVLLHPILGHEIGHAIYSYPQYQEQINQILLDKLLLPSTKFCDEAAAVRWLYDQAAPEQVKLFLIFLDSEHEINDIKFFLEYAEYDAWVEEFLCDFIGLLMFGPSFLAAHCNLLYSADSSGLKIGNSHPPTGCRVNMLIDAAEVLGYDKVKYSDAIAPIAERFWQDIKANRQTDTWFDIFDKKQIKETVEALQTFLSTHDRALYPTPDPEQIESLVTQVLEITPPVGYRFDINEGPVCNEVDFRHVLLAGWIASADETTKIPFDRLNRLCEHGIMQQRAIKLKAIKEEVA